MILFLLTSYLKRISTSAIINLFENTEKVEGLSKIEFKERLSPATKEPSTSKSMESP